ncbi:MAG: hypothetical protein ABJQ72_20170 [Nitratireductor sp.]
MNHHPAPTNPYGAAIAALRGPFARAARERYSEHRCAETAAKSQGRRRVAGILFAARATNKGN